MTLYKHKNNTDIAFEIISKQLNEQEAKYELSVLWWNIGICHEPWCMNIFQMISIPTTDWEKNWSVYAKI